jgi:hypothetical protein
MSPFLAGSESTGSIIHLLFTFARPSGHVARVLFAASGKPATMRALRTKPGVHLASGFLQGK